jgi:GDPmannose 4,6-dehydratase
MLQQSRPDDFVIGTGCSHSVMEFAQEAFAHVNLDWTEYIDYGAEYLRPLEVDLLRADPSKARQQLGWQHSTTFTELVHLMVDAEMQAIQQPTQQNTVLV